MTLTEFLLARIAEDEVVARDASPGPWHINAERDEVLAVDDITVAEGFALSGPQTRATTEHIARHDPARVLAECEAKRRIVELHSGSHECVGVKYGELDTVYVAPGFMYEVDPTLRLLALPYADHPDYREEWKP